ncbi:hypothetical protein [Neisseria gonorrhoeae]|uniref:hypothetical protein n=1 Tax=Neisseria gonorrhoeae TaxID=485 RepID=UPI0021A2AEE9|nr:hypothetical protein [Neisseria gonorrhoeae]
MFAFRRHSNLSKGQNTPVFDCFLLKKTAFHHGISPILHEELREEHARRPVGTGFMFPQNAALLAGLGRAAALQALPLRLLASLNCGLENFEIRTPIGLLSDYGYFDIVVSS